MLYERDASKMSLDDLQKANDEDFIFDLRQYILNLLNNCTYDVRQYIKDNPFIYEPIE